jgi:hypothetical protein
MQNDSLHWIQQWFRKQCDSDWEHESAIRIETLDNPGWSIIINLRGTELENKPFALLDISRSEEDWVHCHVENGRFLGASGPEGLVELIEIFRKWAVSDPTA